jgi:glucosamine 6-phosphate synthetase-like amidotransferase/phosphosugar isomerase protein
MGKMSFVHEALLSQRQVWRQVVQEIGSGGLAESLPARSPKRILIFGVGSSFFAAKLSAFTLVRETRAQKGKDEVFIHACSSVSIGVDVFPRKGDWVFGLSHRGRTPVTARALEVCKKAGAFTVWVTAKGGQAHPSANLTLSTSELEKCEPHTIGMTSAICAVTLLLSSSRTIENWMSLSENPDPDLKVLQAQPISIPSLLIGEWEGEWIAREIRLKLIEMARVRAIVFGSEEFFHGPQLYSQNEPNKCMVSDPIWYLSTPDDLRSRDFPRARHFKISREHSLAWVPSLVELQWLSLVVALNQGRNPDG